MATWLRQSTAVDIALGPFVDQTDGFTAETGLTINQADVRLKKNNGDWAQKNQASSASHEENGWYECSLDTTDTNTLGILIVAVNESGALPVWREFLVVPQQVYDSYLSTDVLQVHAVEISNGLITAAAIAANAITAAAIATDAITAAKIAADAITAAKIATDAITAAKIADGAITAAKIADGAITAAGIATDAIDSDALAASAVAEIQAGIATSLLDLTDGVEAGLTVRQALRVAAAALAGVSMVSAGSRVYRDMANSKDRISAVVSNGDRTTVVLDLS